jgi:hypothetical protein
LIFSLQHEEFMLQNATMRVALDTASGDNTQLELEIMVPKPKLDGGAATYDKFLYLLSSPKEIESEIEKSELERRKAFLYLLWRAKNFDFSVYTTDNPEFKPKKPLWRMWEEAERGDMRLQIDPETGYAVGFGCRVETLIQTSSMRLLETSRLFENNGELVPTVNAKHALREALRLGKDNRRSEGHRHCVIRCVGEELHQYDIDLSQLRYLSVQRLPIMRPSSVYPGLYKKVVTFCYEWNIEKPFELEGPIIRDSGTTVFLNWFDR